MDGFAWFVLTFKDEKALIKADAHESLEHLMSTIAGKWDCLSINNFGIHASVGSLSNLVLNNEDDYHNILALSKQLGSQMIELCVKLISEESPRVNLNVLGTGGHDSSKDAFNIFQNFDFENLQPPVVDSVQTPLGESGQSQEYSGLLRPRAYNISPEINMTPLLSRDWKDCIKGEGQVFTKGRNQFRTELVKYSTARGFCYDYSKNNAEYVYAACREKSNGCQWFIRGKQCAATGCFTIGKCNLVHNCGGNIVNSGNKRLGPKIWGSMIIENVKCKLKHPSVEIRNHIKTSFGMDVEYKKAYRSVEAANGQIYGTYNTSFHKLRGYADATLETNPGSIAFVEQDDETKRFKRAFFAWAACLDGFKDCRPMISIDGTHMYGRWKGVILSATAKDGNNGLFPIAVALVTVENLDNWVWFLEQLKAVLKHPKPIFYLSDRNTGLMSAFPIVFEAPANFYCLFHLHNNLRSYYAGAWSTAHRDTMCSLLTECAYAPNERCFQESLAKFKLQGKGLAEKFLEHLDPKHWAFAFAPHIKRYGEMTSNASESFNNWIKVARGLPVTQMVETIRADVMRWFVERREKADKWCSVLCEMRQHLWNFYVDASRTWKIAPCPDGTYIVHCDPSVVVDLPSQTCTCFQWQIHGFPPCIHATTAIIKYETSIIGHIDPCFFVETYKKAYSSNMNPIPGTAILMAEQTIAEPRSEQIMPPPTNNPPGRPRNKRKKSYGEVPKRKLTMCTKCGRKSRHDALTCKVQGPVQNMTSESQN